MIFVYGTLMRGLGFPMHDELAAQATFVCEGRVNGRLIDLGWYPGLMEGEGWVLGEVYAASDEVALLAVLDAYEGCGKNNPKPHEYRRVARSVYVVDSEEVIEAWVYEYLGSTAGRGMVPRGNFRAFLKGNDADADSIPADA